MSPSVYRPRLFIFQEIAKINEDNLSNYLKDALKMKKENNLDEVIKLTNESSRARFSSY